MNRVLFLWSDVSGYLEDLVFELNNSETDVKVIYWDENISSTKSLYKIKDMDVFIPKSSFVSWGELYSYVEDFNPNIIITCGWMDSWYLFVLFKLYFRKKLPISVIGFDDIYHGSARQILGSLVFRLILKPLFSHAWISGYPQFLYASKFGFDYRYIIYDLYSCSDIYQKKDVNDDHLKVHRKLLYVGRFVDEKNISYLLHSFLNSEISESWELHLVGNGPVKVTSCESVHVHSFKQPEDLVRFMSSFDYGVLASKSEQWGVVLHEMSSVGLGIISSDITGASSSFLIHGFNGYKFDSTDQFSLTEVFDKIAKLSNTQISEHKANSSLLSKRITSTTSAANLRSLINL